MASQKPRVTRKIGNEQEKRRRKTRRIIIFIIIFIAIIVAISAYLLTSPEFQIQDIEIEGNERLTQEEIYEQSGIKLGDNIFKTLEIVARVKLKQNGYIETVNVQKIYPNKIKITITERTEAYQILTETGEYIYIDEQGYIMNHSVDKLEGYAVITGMKVSTENLGHRLEEKDLEKMENILHIKDEANKLGIGEQIQQIDTIDEYVLHLNEDALIINLGNATSLNDRMTYVNAILKKEEGAQGTIYVNGNINEGFAPYFSPR